MSLLDRLERIFGRVAVPNLTLWIIVGQVFVLFAAMAGVLNPVFLTLTPAQAVAGQWWRLVTFLLIPPISSTDIVSLVFLAFGWYMFYLMGGALENYWGTFRYNLFIFIGWALTVGVGFLTPQWMVSNEYLAGSVFLAFAFLNPDFEIILFFILPVKIKWLALIAWIGYAWQFATHGWSVRFQVLAAVGNFLLFFGADIIRTMKHGRRTMARRVERAREEVQPRHVCHVCGKTDISHPDLDFRYCSKCAGDQCYCPEHIHNHAHVVVPETDSRA